MKNCRCSIYRLLKMALNELYYNLSVFAYPVAPEDGTVVTLWLHYYPKYSGDVSRCAQANVPTIFQLAKIPTFSGQTQTRPLAGE